MSIQYDVNSIIHCAEQYATDHQCQFDSLEYDHQKQTFAIWMTIHGEKYSEWFVADNDASIERILKEFDRKVYPPTPEEEKEAWRLHRERYKSHQRWMQGLE